MDGRLTIYAERLATHQGICAHYNPDRRLHCPSIERLQDLPLYSESVGWCRNATQVPWQGRSN